MNKVGTYGAYQNNYDNTLKNQKNKQNTTAKADKKDSASAVKNNTKLSDNAKALLAELRRRYGNMDFMVASFDSDEEAQEYLSRGTKEYSVLIDPEELEKMATDSDYKEKNLSIIEESTGKLNEIKDQLGDKKDEVVNLGVSIGKDGTVSYFAELQKMSDKQKEHIEKTKEAKKEEDAKTAREQAKKAEKEWMEKPYGKRTMVKANSVEELLEKIQNVNWDKVKDEQTTGTGSHFNYSI
ncbi:MAG: DUF6033 family protein [Roseburia sp.]|nr:DUF6033 family protein [Roseburia sp.]